ncbi:MAG: uncharacterized protein K0S74_249 [Chlamydiales bacterium]|jgi:uncharacterized protein|nr:uncharacterized protein [Chlamydiales bacterium]
MATSSIELPTFNPLSLLVEELRLPSRSIGAVIDLLADGNTVPFIARYRKEATGNLDEVQIRTIQERLEYLKELEDRRQTILKSIEEQGKLTDELRKQILECKAKNTLEDLYLPYKPKRRTKAMIAREKGLDPLAQRILEQPLKGDPEEEALAFVNQEKGVADVKAALAGARDIVAEVISERADIRSMVRTTFAEEGTLYSKVAPGKEKEPTKFEQYYDFSESVSKIPSHRYLAIRRGEQEGVLQLEIQVDMDAVLRQIEKMNSLNSQSLFAGQLKIAVEDSYKRLIAPSVETDVRVDLKMRSDLSAVEIFAQNLRNLLLAAPLGERCVIGIDPGIRTGCKCAVVDSTGKYLDNMTIYISQGKAAEERAKDQILAFLKKYNNTFAIAIGNGTGSRETEAFIKETLAVASLKQIIVVSVNEAGASVYSASDVAREEFPELDLTIRGAISIARRLQDPLAELVKIDPKSIGVGQYQHDVYQQLLQDKLSNVVESCVNHVGVELNTASAPLLAHVAGIGESLAKRIVQHREQNGPFNSRQQLLQVKGLGAKTFEQAAGFLRVRAGSNPLDASAVHPERYKLVEQIARDNQVSLEDLIGKTSLINTIDMKRYITNEVGELTLRDIMEELRKPGRDPRAEFERPQFREDILTLEDLKPGMELEGIVTNVAAFGAFVDIGVHQDGLIHVSALSNQFVSDPHEVVQVGQKIKVVVLEVDPVRKRIALASTLVGMSAAKGNKVESAGDRAKNSSQPKDRGNKLSESSNKPTNKPSFGNNPFANLKL